jgi:hypothetical protein
MNHRIFLAPSPQSSPRLRIYFVFSAAFACLAWAYFFQCDFHHVIYSHEPVIKRGRGEIAVASGSTDQSVTIECGCPGCTWSRSVRQDVKPALAGFAEQHHAWGIHIFVEEIPAAIS